MILRRVAVCLAGGSLLALSLAAAPATATHDTPAKAGPLYFSIVPTFRQTISATQCTARSGAPSVHGTPLALTSCNPPAFLPGTVAHFGAQGEGFVQLAPFPGDGDPSNGDTADLSVVASMQDVRSGSATGTDYAPVASGPDLNASAKFRFSDHYNNTPSLGCAATTSCPGTTSDTDFPIPINCVTTADPGVGSNCSVTTTADAVTPNVIQEAHKSDIAIFRIRIRDAGNNNVLGDDDDRDAFMQGIYIP
jgi:hypothetical protein